MASIDRRSGAGRRSPSAGGRRLLIRLVRQAASGGLGGERSRRGRASGPMFVNICAAGQRGRSFPLRSVASFVWPHLACCATARTKSTPASRGSSAAFGARPACRRLSGLLLLLAAREWVEIFPIFPSLFLFCPYFRQIFAQSQRTSSSPPDWPAQLARREFYGAREWEAGAGSDALRPADTGVARAKLIAAVDRRQSNL